MHYYLYYATYSEYTVDKFDSKREIMKFLIDNPGIDVIKIVRGYEEDLDDYRS